MRTFNIPKIFLTLLFTFSWLSSPAAASHDELQFEDTNNGTVWMVVLRGDEVKGGLVETTNGTLYKITRGSLNGNRLSLTIQYLNNFPADSCLKVRTYHMDFVGNNYLRLRYRTDLCGGIGNSPTLYRIIN